MKVVVLQSNYIPWKGYFDLIHDADTFVFYDEVQYTKNDWRNRNQIYTKNGLQWLTIPIHKDAVKLKISEVNIKDEAWQAQHFKSLLLGYKRAPCFSQIEPFLHEVYIENTWRNLSELNRHLTIEVSRMLSIQTKFEDSKTYDLTGDKVGKLLGLLKQLGATEYISGPSGRDYLAPHENLFNENGILINYKNYDGYPEYRQMSHPFVHGVSIIDMLANIPLNEIPRYIWEARTQLK